MVSPEADLWGRQVLIRPSGSVLGAPLLRGMLINCSHPRESKENEQDTLKTVEGNFKAENDGYLKTLSGTLAHNPLS